MARKILLPKSPIALSMSGGGSKGSYAVGITKYLYEHEYLNDVRIIMGTSTGALIGASIAAWVATGDEQHIHRLVKCYETVTDRDILQPNHSLAYRLGGMAGVLAASWAFGGNSIFNTTPLQNLIDKHITPDDWKAIVRVGSREVNPVEIGFCVVNLQTAQSEIITNRTHPDPAILRRALFASANQPFFMPPIKIFDDKPDQYVDGGMLDFNPVEKIFTSSLMNSVDHVLAISLNHIDRKYGPGIGSDSTLYKDNIGELIVRTIRILAESVYDSDIKTAMLYNLLLKVKETLGSDVWEKLLEDMPEYMSDFANEHLKDKKPVPIIHIYPRTDIYMDALKFEQPAMKELLVRGYEDAKEMFI